MVGSKGDLFGHNHFLSRVEFYTLPTGRENPEYAGRQISSTKLPDESITLVYPGRRGTLKKVVKTGQNKYNFCACFAPRPMSLKIQRFPGLLMLLVLTAAVAAAQDYLPDLVRRVKPSAVAIETFDAK